MNVSGKMTEPDQKEPRTVDLLIDNVNVFFTFYRLFKVLQP